MKLNFGSSKWILPENKEQTWKIFPITISMFVYISTYKLYSISSSELWVYLLIILFDEVAET